MKRRLSSAIAAAAAFVSAPLGRPDVAADEPPALLDIWSWGQSRGGLAGGVSPNPTIPWPLSERGEWVDIQSSGFHTLLLDAAGEVWAWGFNDDGQLGDGTHTRRFLPVRVAGLSGIDAIAAGRSHGLAYRRSDGSLWAWGANHGGALGQPPETLPSSATPVRIDAPGELLQIAAGGNQNLVLDATGAVWSWGGNFYGQLGHGDLDDRYEPQRIEGVPSITAIATGNSHSLAVADDGAVWSWGWNVFGQLGYGYQDRPTDRSPLPAPVLNVADAVSVAVGDLHSLAVTSSGRVWAWGYNTEGQTGLGEITPADRGVSIPRLIPKLDGVVRVAGGAVHSGAITAEGAVYGWGAGHVGAVGHNRRLDARAPVLLSSLRGAVAIAAGSQHTVALAPPRAPLAARWFGDPTARPPPGLPGAPEETELEGDVFGPGSVEAMALGETHAVLLDERHRVWQWTAEQGTPMQARLVDVPLGDSRGFVQVAAGPAYALALRSDGTVWAWGEGSRGELGNGSALSSATPVQVELPVISYVAAGHQHALAVTHDGNVWAWGDNRYGQAGVGPDESPLEPAQVPGLLSIVAVSAGAAHSLAVSSVGRVTVWGHNNRGQLGVPTGNVRPTSLELPSRMTLVAAGAFHSVIAGSDGAVYAFGDASDCQTGARDALTGWVLRSVPELENVILLAAGGFHTLALAESGMVHAWGNDSRGQLGLGAPRRRDLCAPRRLDGRASLVTAGLVGSARIGP